MIHIALEEAELTMILDLAAAEVKKANNLEVGEGLLKDWIDGYIGIMSQIELRTKRGLEHHERQEKDKADGKFSLRSYAQGEESAGDFDADKRSSPESADRVPFGSQHQRW